MSAVRVLFLTAALATTGFAATLAISTYLKDGFTPSAIASDPQGNIYLTGTAVTDSASGSTGTLVAKLDPKASQYLYLAYLDSAATDHASAIAVDASGNAYITGWTTNPNFPALGGGALGTVPAGSTDARSFVTKLDPQGSVVFSVLIGGSANSTALGVAITPTGQILVSGIAGSSGFPVTAGAYSVANSASHWFLTELDPVASKTIFSATGIGGSSIALDAGGNIYLAGSSPGTDYPTTPGAYQTTFVQGHTCYFPCQLGFNGNLQHVTKMDAAASKLIYSTGLNDPTGAAGSTTNTGMAVDAAGNVYVTGTLLQAAYPFSVTAPGSPAGYLSKLDPAGANLLFSIPVGGGGVQQDSSGAVYVGGTVAGGIVPGSIPTILPNTTPVPPPAVFSWIPQPCVPDNITTVSEAYVMKIDPASGNVQDGQWIDGSAPSAVGITLATGKVWMTGATPAPDVPFTPGVLAPQHLGPGFLAGAFLSAADFSPGASAAPAIACVLDAGNLTHVGAVAPFQLLSILGANLGPAEGALAPDGMDPSIAGVSVTFDGNPAQLLYVSASQINVAVPVPPPSKAVVPRPTSTVMQITVDGATVQRQFPFTVSNLNLFADLSANTIPCLAAGITANGFQPVALNADGSRNSCANAAPYGSTVSLFVHGIGAEQFGFPPPSQLLGVQAMAGQCSAAVTGASLVANFVYQVDVVLPASGPPCGRAAVAENFLTVTLSYNGSPAGPLVVPAPGPTVNFAPGEPMPMIVWVRQ